jgi:hypothetical protein
MQNPYQAPQSAAPTPVFERTWHAEPSVNTDLKTVWGWLARSWGMLVGISIGVSFLSTLAASLCTALLPQPFGALLANGFAAAFGLVVAAAAIRVVLDHEDGRELAVGKALRFGFSHFGVLILPVALRYMFGVLAAMCLFFPTALVQGRLMSIEALFVLGVEDPSKTVFGGAWELGDGHTFSFAGAWLLLYLPVILMSAVVGLASYALLEFDLPSWANTAVSLPGGLVIGFLSILPALGGLSRLLSMRHAASEKTEYRWRLMEDLED